MRLKRIDIIIASYLVKTIMDLAFLVVIQRFDIIFTVGLLGLIPLILSIRKRWDQTNAD